VVEVTLRRGSSTSSNVSAIGNVIGHVGWSHRRALDDSRAILSSRDRWGGTKDPGECPLRCGHHRTDSTRLSQKKNLESKS